MIAVDFVECRTVGDGNFKSTFADLDGAAVPGELRADGLFPGIVEQIRGGAFEQPAGTDQPLDRIPDGTGNAWEIVGVTLQGGCLQRFCVSGITT